MIGHCGAAHPFVCFHERDALCVLAFGRSFRRLSRQIPTGSPKQRELRPIRWSPPSSTAVLAGIGWEVERRDKMGKRVVLLSVATALLAGAPALATELVTNGGFETGDFTGWTQF